MHLVKVCLSTCVASCPLSNCSRMSTTWSIGSITAPAPVTRFSEAQMCFCYLFFFSSFSESQFCSRTSTTCFLSHNLLCRVSKHFARDSILSIHNSWRTSRGWGGCTSQFMSREWQTYVYHVRRMFGPHFFANIQLEVKGGNTGCGLFASCTPLWLFSSVFFSECLFSMAFLQYIWVQRKWELGEEMVKGWMWFEGKWSLRGFVTGNTSFLPSSV